MTAQLNIDYTKTLNTIHYVEDIFIEEDSIWLGEKRLAAFTLQREYSDDPGKYRVNARREVKLADGTLNYIYPRIAGFDTIEECKEFIVDYINTAPCAAIFAEQHRNAFESLCA